ncbi:acyl-CoA dehydrogenase family protein [Amycolatopsis sp. cmx-4-83]|uniref:acyl-CoA dehydrogenase family protein n=1 Tax=Amycolatopsis sp. cmx-4-83 TaxID=2790940 RepID=UPI00397A7FEF
MRDELDERQAGLAAAVDRVAAAGGEPREVMARLGDERLLAVHFPEGYGGRGLRLADHAAVCERIGALALPDVAHLVTVQAVGCSILESGTGGQRARWLPKIASGRLYASLLLSEPDAGTDLAAITTAATPDGDGWRIRGGKTWSLFTPWSRLALVSARTREGASPYDGISLFLVDPAAPGVTITPVPRAAGEPYHTVTFDDVGVGPDALLGRPHLGWRLLPRAIGFERAGFDYLSCATRWLAAAEREVRGLPEIRRRAMAADLARLRFEVGNARAVAYHAVNSATRFAMDEFAVAYAKLVCGRAAQSVARWAGLELGAGSGGVAAAVAEAPEFTISGGAQELQLDLIANEYPIGGALR